MAAGSCHCFGPAILSGVIRINLYCFPSNDTLTEFFSQEIYLTNSDVQAAYAQLTVIFNNTLDSLNSYPVLKTSEATICLTTIVKNPGNVELFKPLYELRRRRH